MVGSDVFPIECWSLSLGDEFVRFRGCKGRRPGRGCSIQTQLRKFQAWTKKEALEKASPYEF